MSTALTDHMLSSLDDVIEGELVLPADQDWDSARRAWNLAVDQHPAAVVFPAGAEDVSSVVRFASDHDLAIAVQGTGHGAVSERSLAGAVLLNTSKLDGFEIDKDAQTVRVQAGARWGPIVDAAGELGLAPLAGTSGTVGVVGYTLGGGAGWLARKYGLAARSVRSIEVVTADGAKRSVDAANDPELFWALRGGGGSFAAVTAMELALYPASDVYAGWLLWPVERAAEIFTLFAGWVETVPDELSAIVRILHLPPLETIPEALRGKSWAVVEIAYLGAEADGAALLAPVRAAGPVMDTVAVMPPSALSHLHADPPEPAPGLGGGVVLDGLPVDAIDELVQIAGTGSETTLVSIEVRHLGGALARPQQRDGVGVLPGSFLLYAVGVVSDPERRAAVEGDMQAVLAAFAASRGKHDFLNTIHGDGDARGAFTTDAYRRLREIKAAYDRGDLFRSNHPVRPAT